MSGHALATAHAWLVMHRLALETPASTTTGSGSGSGSSSSGANSSSGGGGGSSSISGGGSSKSSGKGGGQAAKDAADFRQLLYTHFIYRDMERRVHLEGVRVHVSKWLKRLERFTYTAWLAFDGALDSESLCI